MEEVAGRTGRPRSSWGGEARPGGGDLPL